MSTEAKEDGEAVTEVDDRLYCSTVADFYTVAAREAISRNLTAFLAQLIITPGELLHSSKYLKRMSDSGRALMNAVDKVGTVQAKQRGQSPGARIRDLNTLISTGVRKVWDEDRDKPAPNCTIDSFLAVAARVKATGAERDYQLGRILADHLFAYKTWRDKVGALVQLAERTRGKDEYRLVELLLAECVRMDPALDQLFGFAERAEDRCNDLIQLWQGNWTPRDTAAPVLTDLAKMITEGVAPGVKASVETALMRAVGGKDPLRSAEPEIELQALFEMFRRMWINGQLLGGAQALSMLERRQARLLSSEGITDLLRERKVVVDRMAFLMSLAGMALGPTNRNTLKTFIDHYFGDKDFVPRVISGQEPPVGKLQTLTTIHKQMKASWLEDGDKAAHLAKLEQAQQELIRRSRLLEQVDAKGGGPGQKVLTLLDLCRKGTFIDGPPMEPVRTAIQTYLADPRFLPEYVGVAQGEERERKLSLLAKTLFAFGLQWVP